MPGVERDKSHQSNHRPPKFRDEMQDTRGIWLTYNCVLFFVCCFLKVMGFDGINPVTNHAVFWLISLCSFPK
jgi:hypothetical protein